MAYKKCELAEGLVGRGILSMFIMATVISRHYKGKLESGKVSCGRLDLSLTLKEKNLEGQMKEHVFT